MLRLLMMMTMIYDRDKSKRKILTPKFIHAWAECGAWVCQWMVAVLMLLLVD